MLVLKTFETKKSFENFFDARVSRCARSMFLAVIDIPLGCARSNSIVPVCLRSVKFFRVCIGKYRIPQKMRHRAFPSNSIASCVFICAQSNSIKYQIPQLKDEHTLTCSSDLKNLQRRAQNLLIQHENLKRTKRLNS